MIEVGISIGKNQAYVQCMWPNHLGQIELCIGEKYDSSGQINSKITTAYMVDVRSQIN